MIWRRISSGLMMGGAALTLAAVSLGASLSRWQVIAWIAMVFLWGLTSWPRSP